MHPHRSRRLPPRAGAPPPLLRRPRLRLLRALQRARRRPPRLRSRRHRRPHPRREPPGHIHSPGLRKPNQRSLRAQRHPELHLGLCHAKATPRARVTSSSSHSPDWPEAMATVLSCTYTARAGRALAFGLPSGKHFHITYNYWANNQLHTADLYTDKPIPQGSLFPIRYNPNDPRSTHHTHAPGASAPDWTPRFALAALVGFFTWLVTLP